MTNAYLERDLDADLSDDEAPWDALPGTVAPRSAPADSGRGRRRHRRRRLRLAARWRADAVVVPMRAARLRLLVWIAVGLALLGVSRQLREEATLFAAPATVTGWMGLVCGLLGVWLVPGQWMSALMMRTGTGLSAWLGMRITATLVWYALVGPVIHHSGEGARVTTDGILIMTFAASVAVAVGLLLGMSTWPTRRWQRVLLPAALGAVAAQIVIVTTMRLWTYDMNYAHIRRLDWLIVLCCAVLVTAAVLSRPVMPPVRTPANLRGVLVALFVLALTAAALSVVDERWSPEQQMPSAFAVEQIPASAGTDVALSLTGIGPEGPELIRRAKFSVFDVAGRELLAQLHITDGTLLVTLPGGSQQTLCRPDAPAKVTVRDSGSGLRAQATLPDGWCLR